MLEIEWTTYSWESLNIDQLYDLMSLRQTVFIVEQQCYYQDADGIDQQALHVVGRTAQGVMVAYCRVYPEEDGWHIGRVLVEQSFRGQGLANQVMLTALQQCEIEHAAHPGMHLLPTHLSAQCHLTGFYQTLGYQSVGEPYVEDGIPHQDMRRDRRVKTMKGSQHE